MFNETTSGLGAIDCGAVKSGCEAQWPDDGSTSNSPQQQGFNSCLRSAGFYDESNGCFEFTGHDNPGATTYPIDVLTNPDNPNSLWANLSELGPTSLLFAAAIGLGLVWALGRR